MGALEGKVAVITGAGHGLGFAYAKLFAREGAKLVLNDLGLNSAGGLEEGSRAESAARAIRQAGGEAVAIEGDCTSWDTAKSMIDRAVSEFGKLDILVNNAGFIRDRMIFNMSEADWDDIVHVHLKGHFCPTRHAVVHWRERVKAGEQVSGRVITTTSLAAILGNGGQTNYVAAKMGIIGFTISLSREVARYGVTANVVAPLAETRPEVAINGMSDEVRKLVAVEQVAPLVAYLASDHSANVTGQVFQAAGGRIDRFDGWRLVDGVFRGDRPWTVAELAGVFEEKVAGENPDPPAVTLMRVLQPIVEAAGGEGQDRPQAESA